jgi:3-methylcrotonyl-CoA carboxylase alpha subunit
VRIETGVREGDEVTVHYDPMIAKLVVKGTDRNRALTSLRACLAQYNIAGLSTNIDFLQSCASHPEFVAGNVTTDFIPEFEETLLAPPAPPTSQQWALAAAMQCMHGMQNAAIAASDVSTDDVFSAWDDMDSFAVNHIAPTHITLTHGDTARTLAVTPSGDDRFTVTDTDTDTDTQTHTVHLVQPEDDASLFNATVDGHTHTLRAVAHEHTLHLFADGMHTEFDSPEPAFLASSAEGASANVLTAPMTGTVVKVQVKPGDTVKKDQILVVMEAMKMELVIRAPRDGVVASVTATATDLVAEATPLIALEEEEEEASE